MPGGQTQSKGDEAEAVASIQVRFESPLMDERASVSPRQTTEQRLRVLQEKYPEHFGFAEKFAKRFHRDEAETAQLIEKFITEALATEAEERRTEELHQRYLAAKQQSKAA